MKYTLPFLRTTLPSEALDQIERLAREVRKSMTEPSLAYRPSGQFRGKPLYTYAGPGSTVGIDCGTHVFVMEIAEDGEAVVHKVDKADWVKL